MALVGRADSPVKKSGVRNPLTQSYREVFAFFILHNPKKQVEYLRISPIARSGWSKNVVPAHAAGAKTGPKCHMYGGKPKKRLILTLESKQF